MKLIQENYTSKQAGFISRESGYSNEVLVVVRWKAKADSDASMKKFMEDKSVEKFADMIKLNTMKMKRYTVE